MMKKMCGGHMVAMVLVVVGALNWGLVGAFSFNLVDTIFGMGSWLARIVYILVGLSGLMMLFCGKCKGCKMGCMCDCNKCTECVGSGMKKDSMPAAPSPMGGQKM